LHKRRACSLFDGNEKFQKFILGFLYILYLFFALCVHRADRERLTQLAIKEKLLLRFDYGWSGVRMVLDARPPSPPCKEKDEETGPSA
jgi:hypothetical protein